MEFNELIADFATRHKVDDLVAVDGAAALDIDGIIVTIVSNADVLTFSAEIGEPPSDGAAMFADILLEANVHSDVFFAKAPKSETYIAVKRLSLVLVDDDAFDAALEAFVNYVETWRRMLTDFRPLAKASAERAEAENPSLGTNDFMQV